MTSNFELFTQQLDDAVNVIESSHVVFDSIENIMSSPADIIDTQSLLERCNNICRKHEEKKPTIRVIHHFACTGGTLISKCLSALPNIFLLSEVHPFTTLHLGTGKAKFLPSDITSLAKHAQVPNHSKIAAEIFSSSILKVYEHVHKYGGGLILRDHTHSDYCVGEFNSTTESSVIKVLETTFNINSIVTIRNPIDSFMSLKKNGWEHFIPFTFDEYCRRVCQMLNDFSHAEIFLYEDFISDTECSVRNMCKALDITYDDMFLSIFDVFTVTGDSGRSGSVIKNRERREYNDSFKAEIEQSVHFKIIEEKIGYTLGI